MAYGKFKMGKSKPMPIGLDDLRNRSKKPPKPGKRPEPLTPRGPRNPVPGPGTRPAPLTPRTPGKVRPDVGYGPGKKPAPGNGSGPVRPRPLPKPRRPKNRGM